MRQGGHRRARLGALRRLGRALLGVHHGELLAPPRLPRHQLVGAGGIWRSSAAMARMTPSPAGWPWRSLMALEVVDVQQR